MYIYPLPMHGHVYSLKLECLYTAWSCGGPSSGCPAAALAVCYAHACTHTCTHTRTEHVCTCTSREHMSAAHPTCSVHVCVYMCVCTMLTACPCTCTHTHMDAHMHIMQCTHACSMLANIRMHMSTH